MESIMSRPQCVNLIAVCSTRYTYLDQTIVDKLARLQYQ